MTIVENKEIKNRDWHSLLPISLALCLAFPPLTVVHAQSPAKQFAAVFATTPPVIDGDLDESIWQSAALIEDFYEREPDEFSPARETVRIRVLYDEDNLYVGAEIDMNDVERVTAFKLAQGSDIQLEDRFKVILDPYNNHRTGYDFRINPNGVREESLIGPVGSPNSNWNGIWNGQAKITDAGWTAEISVPFKTLSFDPDNQDWGISFVLNISGSNERVAWTSKGKTTRPGSLGLMTGINRARQGRGIDIRPSISLRKSKNFVSGAEHLSVEPSIDAFFKLTPVLTAALTVNTDFSSAEVDDRVINLERFSVLFPEKRTFFLQDADIFSFADIEANGMPFFSRRIGLDQDNKPIDIVIGGKVTGRIGPVNLGILDVGQDAENDDVNLFVSRAYVNVFDYSTLGLIFTNGSPDPAVSNSVLGVDFNYVNREFSGDRVASSSVWYQQSRTAGISSGQEAYGFSVAVPQKDGYFGGFDFMSIGENFNPALGFVNRAGIHSSSLEFGYSRLLSSDRWQEFKTSLEFQQVTDLTGNTESELLKITPISVTSNAADVIGISLSREREVLTGPFEIFSGVIIDVDDYSWDQVQVDVLTGSRRMFAVEGTLAKGGYYDGNRIQIAAEILWQPSKYFSLATGLDYNDIELSNGRFITRLITLRTDVALNSTWSWNTLAQYDNEFGQLAVNSRLRWVPKAGQEMILVLNHGLVMDEPIASMNRNWRSVESDVVLKASYTFRY